ncbi:hypothetical protein AB0K11_23295 [Mycobacterium sp. NPDC050551]|uniref:hypothetical protein n=1 Tax=Mycobacterium sp. NPDC050551 TaxID=3155407 RepID=UPI0034282B7A
MKKFAIALAAVCIGGLAAAPSASAEQAPLTEGSHTFIFSDGATSAVTVAYDCGPDCFSMGDASSREQFRFDGARWVTASGISTADGRNYLNKNGQSATVT